MTGMTPERLAIPNRSIYRQPLEIFALNVIERTWMPSLIKAPGEEEMRRIDAGLEEDYKRTMY
jgi:hypothetical protein